MNHTEIWQYIPGYSGHYEVSTHGRVRSWKTGTPVTLRLQKGVRGYLQVNLCLNGMKTKPVHRLVALTFIHNPDNLPQVNHADGDKCNNTITNLEWVTASENVQHSYDIGISPRGTGENSRHVKLTYNEVVHIRRLLRQKLTQKEVASRFGVSRGCIAAIAQGTTWTHVK